MYGRSCLSHPQPCTIFLSQYCWGSTTPTIAESVGRNRQIDGQQPKHYDRPTGSPDQPHPVVLPHLRRSKTPDMAQTCACPQKFWEPVETFQRILHFTLRFTFHLSHWLCPSIAGCSPPPMLSIVLCLMLSCFR